MSTVRTHATMAIMTLWLSACSDTPEPEPPSIEIAAVTVPGPQSWFARHGTDTETITALPANERILRLNQAVYADCEPGSTETLDELFENCRAACGGISWLLRQLLEETGLETRYANLYNIPNQGNHTVVEVNTDDGWVMVDPTFGTWFEQDGRVLDLEDLASRRFDANDTVRAAPNEQRSWKTEPIEQLYSHVFDAAHMSLDHYNNAEAYWFGGEDEMSILSVPLRPSQSYGNFSADTYADFRSQWYKATNRLLLDDDPTNDVSFVASQIYSKLRPSVTILKLEGVEPGKIYALSVRGWSKDNTALKVQPLEDSANWVGPVVTPVSPNFATVTGQVIPNETPVRIALTNSGPGALIHAYAFSLDSGVDMSEGAQTISSSNPG